MVVTAFVVGPSLPASQPLKSVHLSLTDVAVAARKPRKGFSLPNTGQPLPILCPKCQHLGCRLVVKSLSVMTCSCAACDHTWASEIDALPREISEKVRAILPDL